MSAPLSLFLPVTVEITSFSFAKVRRYTLADALHSIPELCVEVFCEDADIDMAELLGQRAVVHLDEPAVPRFDGVVRAVEQRALDVGGTSVYALTVVPWLWLTTKRAGHRIFQDRTAVGIVEELLRPYGAAMEKPESVILQQSLPVHEYRVQCGEQDHDFLFRILAEQGLVSSFLPDAQGKRVWVVTDDTSIGSVDLAVPYRPASGALAATSPHVSAAWVNGRLCSSEVRLRDYDYRKPGVTLEARSLSGDSAGAEEPLTRYSFAVGRFDDEGRGARLSGVGLEQARSKSRTYRWEASFAMRPGMKIRLQDHPRDDANGDFLVVSAWSEVDLHGRSHRAEVVPATDPWRPEPQPKARIQGTQTAFVVGANGKEIDVDDEGRVAVRFHWDTRPGGQSRRVRVAMPWAGPGRGFWTLPRVGDEVVIGYLDGDPDQPLVVGSVNNAAAPTALAMPEHQTRSAWVSQTSPGGDGYNFIQMEDAKGEELLAFRAQRNLHCQTVRDSTTTVGGNATLTVGGGAFSGGGNLSTRTSGDLEVASRNIAVHSTGEMSLQCDGSRKDITAGFHTVTADDLLLTGVTTATLNGGTARMLAIGEGGKVEIEAAASIELKVGSSSITMVDGKITLSSPLIELNP